MLISQRHFDGPFSSSWAFAGRAKANGLSEAHGPPHKPRKVQGPRRHYIPMPPSRWPWVCDKTANKSFFLLSNLSNWNYRIFV